MPRKGYNTITVKVESFNKFMKVKHGAKRENPDLDNSAFLESLLEHKKAKSMKPTWYHSYLSEKLKPSKP